MIRPAKAVLSRAINGPPEGHHELSLEVDGMEIRAHLTSVQFAAMISGSYTEILAEVVCPERVGHAHVSGQIVLPEDLKDGADRPAADRIVRNAIAHVVDLALAQLPDDARDALVLNSADVAAAASIHWDDIGNGHRKTEGGYRTTWRSIAPLTPEALAGRWSASIRFDPDGTVRHLAVKGRSQ